MNDNLGRIWKELVVAYLRYYPNMPGGSEENVEKP
jgi:hypothetical protein